MSHSKVHPIFQPILDAIAPKPRAIIPADDAHLVSIRAVIARQEANASRITVGRHSLRRWPNGTLIVEGPAGEGVQIPEAELESALAALLRRTF